MPAKRVNLEQWVVVCASFALVLANSGRAFSLTTVTTPRIWANVTKSRLTDSKTKQAVTPTQVAQLDVEVPAIPHHRTPPVSDEHLLPPPSHLPEIVERGTSVFLKPAPESAASIRKADFAPDIVLPNPDGEKQPLTLPDTEESEPFYEAEISDPPVLDKRSSGAAELLPAPSRQPGLLDRRDGQVLLPVPPEEEATDVQAPVDRPLRSIVQIPDKTFLDSGPPYYRTPVDAPLGFTGPSSVLPSETQSSNHFVPVEDRWRIGFPAWDRYGKGHPITDDYPYEQGNWWNPFDQNVLKGDYPIFGQNTFLRLTATSRTLIEPRQTPIATTAFESTVQPFQEEFFGDPNQYLFSEFLVLTVDLFHGDAAFKPFDWRLKLMPIFNVNYLTVNEVAVVNPDVRRGLSRGRTFMTLEEWYFETKLADIGPDYDFISLRGGSQFFNSDFRGFIFVDVNRAVRLFGSRNQNREQFNLIYFNQLEKDTNSELNTLQDNRHRQIFIANYFMQDFIWPGYTAQSSIHYQHDTPTFRYDDNSFLVRPDPVGVFQPHGLDVVYLGLTGDGHINRFNINHALYWALGRDSRNPLANQGQDVNAQMLAMELSYDRDWIRFRTSFFWASGDDDINNSQATGFDAILDNPAFAGGEFSYWQRQAIRLFGVNLTNRESLLPSLKASKIQGQSNYVNPGLFLANVGMDFEITPKLRAVTNANLLWFDSVNVLRQFVYQEDIQQFIGTDLSLGVEYRPLLSNNVIMTFGVATLIPSTGFENLYNTFNDNADVLFASFMDLILTY